MFRKPILIAFPWRAGAVAEGFSIAPITAAAECGEKMPRDMLEIFGRWSHSH